MARVLVLSPHPDDEAIGCGGTLYRHNAAGDSVRAVFLTSGERGGHSGTYAETAAMREREAAEASGILGIQHLEFWHARDGNLQANVSLTKRLDTLLREWKPDLLYTTHAAEAHSDHQAAARLVRRTLTHFEGPWPAVRLFEIWTPLQRVDYIEDITACMEVKLRAIRAYASQMAHRRFDEAVAGLNRYRGKMHGGADTNYAEAFSIMLKGSS